MNFDGLEPASWYPGHMRRAERDIQQQLRVVDVIVELLDARAPASTHNPGLIELCAHRARVVVLGKCDLAEPDATNRWRGHFRSLGIPVLTFQPRARGFRQALLRALDQAVSRQRRERGTSTPRLHATRALVLGVPNVGKSTLINRSTGRAPAATGPRPGVTRSQQWIQLNEDFELLDSPGIMMPRLETVEIGLRLGLLGVLKDELIGVEVLAEYWLHLEREHQRWDAARRYGCTMLPETTGELLRAVGEKRGLRRPGGDPDLAEAARILIGDFRAGKLPPLSIETPA